MRRHGGHALKSLLLILAFAASAHAGSITTGGVGSGSITSGGVGSGSISSTTQNYEAAPLPNGLIGNTTINDLNTRSSNTFFYTSYTVTQAGQVSYCHARVDPGSVNDDFTIGIYETDGNLLAYVNVTNVGSASAGWYGGALNTPVTLTDSTSYIIGLVANQSIGAYKDGSEAGHYRRRISMTYGATLSDTSFASYTSDSESNAHNFQCDNTAAIP